jgi:Spy/CpxP family protein refolding chaperone
MIRTKLVVGAAFALALCAGVAVGLVSARIPEQRHKPHGGGEPRSFLADELNLSPQQREQMKAIWQDVARGRSSPGGGRDGRDDRRRMERERNEAILAAITDPEQRRRVEEVMQQFEQRQQEMAQERQRTFDEAIKKTMAILDENQRKKYEQILQRRRAERESRNSSSTAPSTMPATAPTAASAR